MNILDLDLLTPGSVWHNTKNGKTSRVLCITNASIPEKLKESYPQQVVYLDEEGNFLSVNVDSFISKRSFYNVDPALEAAMSNLSTFFEDGPSDEDVENLLNGEAEDEGSLLVVDDSDEDTEDTEEGNDGQAEDEVSYVTEQPAVDNPLITYIPAEEGMRTVIEASVLAVNTISYDQSPMLGSDADQIMHSLIIASTSSFTKAELTACFKQDSLVGGYTPFIFQVGDQLVDWDMFAGVYSVMYLGAPAYKVVLLGSPNALDETDADDSVFDLGEPSPGQLTQEVDAIPAGTPVSITVAAPQQQVTTGTGVGLQVAVG